MPIKTSYYLILLNSEIVKHTAIFEELRTQLIEKYGEKNETGGLKIDEQKSEYILSDKIGFDKEYKELLDISLELPGLSLKEVGELTLSPALTQYLVKFLTP
jgi:hypothetical protein